VLTLSCLQGLRCRSVSFRPLPPDRRLYHQLHHNESIYIHHVGQIAILILHLKSQPDRPVDRQFLWSSTSAESRVPAGEFLQIHRRRAVD